MTKIQNPKQKTITFEPVWNLEFELCLRFGACDLLFLSEPEACLFGIGLYF